MSTYSCRTKGLSIPLRRRALYAFQPQWKGSQHLRVKTSIKDTSTIDVSNVEDLGGTFLIDCSSTAAQGALGKLHASTCSRDHACRQKTSSWIPSLAWSYCTHFVFCSSLPVYSIHFTLKSLEESLSKFQNKGLIYIIQGRQKKVRGNRLLLRCFALASHTKQQEIPLCRSELGGVLSENGTPTCQGSL